MSRMTDQDELLLALDRLRGGATNARPSVQQARLSYLPEWTTSRMFDVFDDLTNAGLVMDPRGPMTNIDITSAGNSRIAALIAPPAPNSIHIGTAINSPVQQVGSHGVGTQNIAYELDRSAIEDFVAYYRDHSGDLPLDDRSRKKADAQVATIEAQLEDDDPNPVIIKEAGRSVRAIIEGAIGSIAATAAINPAAWTLISSTLG